MISRTVKVTAAAVTQGSLSVTISATNEISQPGAPVIGGAAGETAGVTNAEIQVSEEARPMFLLSLALILERLLTRLIR